MAFTLVPSTCGGCNTVVYTDETGTYNATTNPGGYGGPGAPSTPADFSTYTLELWFPGSDRSDPADYTLDLLTDIPSPDADGHYEWTAITLADLGLTELTSGVWLAETTAIYSGTDYGKVTKQLFTSTIAGELRTKINAMDWSCHCKCRDGQPSPLELWDFLQGAKMMAKDCGNPNGAQELIDYVTANKSSCC